MVINCKHCGNSLGDIKNIADQHNDGKWYPIGGMIYCYSCFEWYSFVDIMSVYNSNLAEEQAYMETIKDYVHGH